MTKKVMRLTEAELSVLEVLWKRGPATIREITEQVYPEQTAAEYATVQKLLERLESKGCVARDRSGFAHILRAVVERSAVLGQELQEVADKLCNGSLTPLLMHLVQRTRLSAKDRKLLQKLIDEA